MLISFADNPSKCGPVLSGGKIKKVILINIPVSACNLRCKYCYITQQNRWGDKISDLGYSPEQVGKALSFSRLGGSCLINICAGGETLLAPYLTDILEEVLEQGHYVELVTNGTLSKKIDEILRLPPHLLAHLIFKFSFHYEELKRLDLIDVFFDNVRKARAVGCSITVELTVFDELLPEIENIQKICREKLGVLCHLTIGRNDSDPAIPILSKYPIEEYKEKWSSFDSPMFDFKLTTYYVKRKEFCYAGEWSFYLNLNTGVARQCYKSAFEQNIFDRPDSPIISRAIGNCCQEPHCYNSHAFLTLGLIPSLNSPNYLETRNRECDDGADWFSADAKEFYSHKLCESNLQHGRLKQRLITIGSQRIFLNRKIVVNLHKIKNKLKRLFYE